MNPGQTDRSCRLSIWRLKARCQLLERAFFICNASRNKTVYLRNQNFISVDSGTIESDYLVIGSGLAGLYSALKADRKSTRLNSSHVAISYAVFCLKKKKNNKFKIDLLYDTTYIYLFLFILNHF